MGKRRKVNSRIRYNKETKLDIGEVYCKKCRGFGMVEVLTSCDKCRGGTKLQPMFCDYCQGQGKLDWIENATGGKPIPEYDPDADWDDEIPF